MKKLLSVFITFILIANTICLSANAENNEITASEMHDQLCSMILKNEGVSAASPGLVFPTNRLLVKTNSNEKLEENYGATDSVEGYKNIHIFQYDSITKTDYAYQNFLNDDIEYVEYDFYFTTNSDSTTSYNSDNNNIEHLSWNSEAVQVDDAFNLIKERNTICQNVTVAIIDTGIYAEHEYFSTDRIIDSGYARVDDSTGVSFSSLSDDANHGTHVAGIIYDNTMDNVFLCPYRIYPTIERAPYSVIWLAFELAVKNGADVINMSIEGKENNEIDENGKKYCISLSESISEASENGIIVVASAGNYKGDADTNFPACCPGAITVAATNSLNVPDLGYSASGKCVDVAAPGTDINSTVPRVWSYLETWGHSDRTYDSIPQSLYLEKKGTSMATPLVSAAAAMIKSIDPDITPAEVKRLIKETAFVPDNWEESCNGKNYGTGIVNFYNIAKAMLDPEYSATPTISVNSDNKFEITAPDGIDAKIFYTLDGTTPSLENHFTYTAPLNLSSKNIEVVKAACYENGKFISEPAVYDMITNSEKTIFYKWSGTLTTDADTSKANWRSYNPNIASVDSEGNIKGVSKGDTKITCTLPTGEKIIWKVNVKYSPLQAFFVMFFFGFLWI